MESTLRKCRDLVLAASVCSAAVAQSSHNDNAAIWYRKAIERQTAIPGEQLVAILDWDWDQPPTPELRAHLADPNIRAMLDDFRRGTAQSQCNFELDRSQGFALLAPHLSQLRTMARITRADIAVAFHDGDSPAAVTRLGDLYRLSGHFETDGFLISSLVGQAIFGLADSATQTAIDQAAISPEQTKVLLESIRTLSVDDPFNFVAAMIGEREMALATLEQFQNAEDRIAFAQSIGIALDEIPLDDAQIQQGIEQYGRYMDKVVEAFGMEDPAQAQTTLEQLEAELEAGEHGLLCMYLCPALAKAYKSKLLGEEALGSRIAMLESLARGKVKPEDLANAAEWYRRAAYLLRAIDHVTIAGICTAAGQPEAPLEEDTAAALKRSGDIVTLMRKGAALKRCQFNRDRHLTARRWYLVPDHLPDMHELLCVLLADAVRLHNEHDSVGACDRLAIAIGVIAHLAAEPHPTGSLIAHTAFSRAVRIMAGVFATGSPDEQILTRLDEALQRNNLADAFAYKAATIAVRETFIELHAKRAFGGSLAESPQRDAAIRTINNFNGDEVLCVLATMQELAIRHSAAILAAQKETQAKAAAAAAAAAVPATQPATTQPVASQSVPAPAPEEPRPDPLLRLTGIFSDQALELIRTQLEPFDLATVSFHPWDIPRMRTGPLPLLAGEGGIEGRIAHAIGDLTRATTLLNDARK